MRKYLFLVLVINLLLLKVFAEASTEDAMILNQELQFLEDSVKNIQSTPQNEVRENMKLKKTLELEEAYFEDSMKEDSVSTKSPSQKRRSL